MSEMPELRVGDEVVVSEDVEARSRFDDCHITPPEAVRVWGVENGMAGVSAYGCLHIVDTADFSRTNCTIHRDGVQIWPVPEPSIEERLAKTLYRWHSEGLPRPTPETTTAEAQMLCEHFNITRKEGE